MAPMSEFEGQVAIVTGAAGGVGREVVRLLHEAGASVVAEDLSPAVTALETGDGRIVALQGDVAEAATAEEAVRVARERFGRLDVLVNNAARFLMKPMLETTDDEWDELMRVNVRGFFVHARAALPALAERDASAIVNMASISGLVGLPLQTAYCSTKGAIVQLTRQLAVEFAPQGVRVNGILIGLVESGQWRRRFEAREQTELDWTAWSSQLAKSKHIPLGRLGLPIEAARAILFLASPLASYTTGAHIDISGGHSRHA